MIKKLLATSALLAAALVSPAAASATTFEVGPGRPLANVGDVPWESLTAGDTVLIYYRATPCLEKFVLAAVGTPSAGDGAGGPGPTASAPSSTAMAQRRARSSTTPAAYAA
jgi:hypothetical protein